MSVEQIYVANKWDETEDKKGLVVKSGRSNGDAPYPLVRPDFDMVQLPILWKHGREYRVFSARLLDKVYQLRKKTKSVAILWEQGTPISAKVGKILTGD